jgi:hypothetical protein
MAFAPSPRASSARPRRRAPHPRSRRTAGPRELPTCRASAARASSSHPSERPPEVRGSPGREAAGRRRAEGSPFCAVRPRNPILLCVAQNGDTDRRPTRHRQAQAGAFGADRLWASRTAGLNVLPGGGFPQAPLRPGCASYPLAARAQLAPPPVSHASVCPKFAGLVASGRVARGRSLWEPAAAHGSCNKSPQPRRPGSEGGRVSGPAAARLLNPANFGAARATSLLREGSRSPLPGR